MTLYIFLLVIVSLMCGSSPAVAEPSSRAVMASVLLVSGWVLLAHIAARLLARQVIRGSLEYGEAVGFLRMQMETFRWFALPITLLCHYGFSLSAWLRVQPILEDSMAFQAIGLLAPGLTLLLATWSAEYWFAAIIGIQEKSVKKALGAMTQMMRSGPAWLILPTLVFLSLGDIAGKVQTDYFTDPDAIGGGNSGNLVWWLIGLGVAAIAVALPYLVRLIAKTEPVSDVHRREVETWLQRCGISTHRLFGMKTARWNTGGRLLNAMVAGIVRPGRLLLLSDRLLDELPRGQRLMVVMHEIAHVRRFHVPIRMAAILPAWVVSSWSSAILIDSQWLTPSMGAAVGGALGLITTVVVLGTVSHLSELDADATACRLAVRACDASRDRERRRTESGEPTGQSTGMLDVPMTREMAAEMMADALTRVTADHPSSRKFSWLHPSLATRVARLRRISRPLPDLGSDSHTLAI
ncbi:M48 family metalloprotease [Aporhodopirellula aestuarii]|uniref:M48 family metalloprotease n=1 Tax=Aporhodopirellula aestuarii TaxID=2950107 RepID=A0ABT0TXS9_9BACT|nr:M48 family metalloprotease [Aporhodopirellula aestuarii]MCM2369404.1 M48 family metalloprotease [Aporhodopirellula aestuarii]